VTYIASRDDANPNTVWVLDLEDLGLRYKSDRDYSPTTAATAGLQVNNALSAELDMATGELEFDDYKVTIADASGALLSSLSANDLMARGTKATLKYGFNDIAEEEFHRIVLYLHDWDTLEDGGLRLTLRTSLTFLARPVFTDISRDSVALLAALAPNATTISFNTDLSGDGKDWPTSGTVMITNNDTKEVELLTYTGLTRRGSDRSDATVAARRLRDVGKGGLTWPVETSCELVWERNLDPITMFLQLATTTEGGGNGSYDQADGIGLGDKVEASAIDFESFEEFRDTLLVAGVHRKGVYVGKEEIDDLEAYFEAEFRTLGWYMTVTREGKLGLRKVATIQSTAIDITTKIDLVSDERVAWDRDMQSAENDTRLEYDYDPNSGEYLTSIPLGDPRSKEAFGQAGLLSVSSRGLRGVRGRSFGWPDLGWDRMLERRRWELITELANPSKTITVEGNLSLQDLELGSLVQLTHPGIPDLESGTMGVTDALFYVTKMEHKPEDRRVELGIRQRRHMGRPFYIAPDAVGTWVKTFRANFTLASGESFADDAGVWDTGRYVHPATGKGEDGTLTAGWDTAIPDGRDRDLAVSPDERHDSYQFNGSDDPVADARFRLTGLTDGIYRIKILSGDASTTSLASFNVSGWQIVSDDPVATAEWKEYTAYIEIVAGQVLTVAAGGGVVTVGNSVWNSLEVDKLDIASSAGYGHVYRLNCTGDPVAGIENFKGVDAPGWTGFYTGHAGVERASIYPRQYLSARSTLRAGWVLPDGDLDIANLDRRGQWGVTLDPEYNSSHWVHDGFGANPPPTRTIKINVRKGKYLVLIGASAPVAGAIHRVNTSVNGVLVFDDVFLTPPSEIQVRGLEVDVDNGVIEIDVGGGATAGLNVISTIQVIGRAPTTSRRVDFTVPAPANFEWGYEAVDGVDAFSTGAGIGWDVLPTGAGGAHRELNDPTLYIKGKRWDSFVFTNNNTPATLAITKDENGVALPNGTYWFRAGVHVGNPRLIYILVNGVVIANETPVADVFNEYEGEIQVTNGRVEVTIGDGTSGSSTVINWLVVERMVYYEGGDVRQQYGHAGPGSSNVFGDGRRVYDHGV